MFSGARLFPSVTGSQMLATGDFNHDGFLDLAVGASEIGATPVHWPGEARGRAATTANHRLRPKG